ncbi:MAG: DUF4082 domain-containing protein [Bryobacteraceae bacterium]
MTTYKQTSNATAEIDASFGGVTKTAELSVKPDPVTAKPVSIFKSTAVPAIQSDPDYQSVELGMKFQSDVAGTVTGIRFYKGRLNKGRHIGHLWTARGDLLGTVTFVNETAYGWQQANFSKPVAIQPNTVYVVSYHAPRGYYADDTSFFTSAFNNPPLHALQDGTNGPNGLYIYGGSAFPDEGWQASNYWVDVVFVPSN